MVVDVSLCSRPLWVIWVISGVCVWMVGGNGKIKHYIHALCMHVYECHPQRAGQLTVCSAALKSAIQGLRARMLHPFVR